MRTTQALDSQTLQQTNKQKSQQNKTSKKSFLVYLYAQLHSLGIFLELSSRITCLWEAYSSSNRKILPSYL